MALWLLYVVNWCACHSVSWFVFHSAESITVTCFLSFDGTSILSFDGTSILWCNFHCRLTSILSIGKTFIFDCCDFQSADEVNKYWWTQQGVREVGVSIRNSSFLTASTHDGHCCGSKYWNSDWSGASRRSSAKAKNCKQKWWQLWLVRIWSWTP